MKHGFKINRKTFTTLMKRYVACLLATHRKFIRQRCRKIAFDNSKTRQSARSSDSTNSSALQTRKSSQWSYNMHLESGSEITEGQWLSSTSWNELRSIQNYGYNNIRGFDGAKSRLDCNDLALLVQKLRSHVTANGHISFRSLWGTLWSTLSFVLKDFPVYAMKAYTAE